MPEALLATHSIGTKVFAYTVFIYKGPTILAYTNIKGTDNRILIIVESYLLRNAYIGYFKLLLQITLTR